MTREKLLLLNAARWLKAHAVEWGLLGVVYSITLAILLQAIAQALRGEEIPLSTVWLASSVLLSLPLVLEKLPTAGLGFRRPARMPAALLRHPLAALYLAQELRRLPTWITLILTVALGGIAFSTTNPRPFLWVAISLLPLLRALYSWGSWRRLAQLRLGSQAGRALLESLFIAQTIQGLIAWIALGISLSRWEPAWANILLPQIAALAAACSVSLEADSGRPWLVQTIALSAGLIGGAIAFANPWLALIPLWFFYRMRESIPDRIASLEPLDEDAVLS